MWSNGTLQVNGVDFEYHVKHYAEPSEFGIGCGRVSKLYITSGGYVVCSYERGWDEVPASETAKKAVNMLLERYN